MLKRHYILLYVFLTVFFAASGQTNCYNNSSMEGTSQAHQVPSPWNTCWGSPDTQPGQWGFTQPASNGSTYVSFLATNNYGYLEGMTQPLTTPMVAGQTYSFTVDLAHSPVYNTAEPGNCYSSIAVWGGMGACQKTELLYCSGIISNTNWQTYTITFTPTQNWTYIGFSPCFISSCSGYINLMMDNISCIAPVSTLVATTNVTCYGYCDGTATASPTAGTPPFTYLWNTGATTPGITGLCPGNYWVTVTDNNNLTASDTVTISEPAQMTVQLTVNTSPCTGASTGSITATPTGDAPPFTYQWNPSTQTTATITGLGAGVHSVTVTDTSGCTVTGSTTINALPLPPANAGPNQSICIGNSATLTASGGTGYLWSTTQTTASITVTPQNTTTYTVTVTGANGCTATDDVVVTVNSLPPADAGPNQTICVGQFADFTATGGTSYVWSNGATTAAIHVNPTTTTTYTVTVTDANTCSATDNVVLTVNPLPTPDAGQDVSICFGNSTLLNATGGVTYLWTPAAGLNDATLANPQASPSVTTTYVVNVTDNNNCSNTDDVVVTVWTLPPASAGTSHEICIGDSTSLTASGGVSYLWNTGDTLLTISMSPQASTTYTITVTDGNGCSETDEAVITVNPLPLANAGSDVNICYGLSTTLNASGGTSYHWSPATGLSNPNVSNPVAFPTTATTYTVTVTDANGCSETDDLAIGIYPAPAISFSALPLNGCEPLPVNFTDHTTPTIASWIWTFGDIISGSNTSSAQNPSHLYENSGLFDVTLSVVTTDGCTDTVTVPDMIEVYPNPTAYFLLNPSVGSIDNSVVFFQDASTLAVSWAWNFGDPSSNTQNFSSIPNPSHQYSFEGTYPVLLVVTSAHGCADSTTHDVIIKPTHTFYIPNVFTPDNDGINDFFQGYGSEVSEYDMYIFNRWGEMVFESHDYNLPWDGKMPESNEAYMQDVYVYKIIIKERDGKRKQYYGHVTLLK